MQDTSLYQQNRRIFYGAFAGAVVGLLVAVADYAGFLEGMNYLFLGGIYNVIGQSELDTRRIKVIGITSDKGVTRKEYAALIRKLNRAGVKLICFDVIFPEREEKRDEETLDLGAAIQEKGNVILPIFEKYSPQNRHSRFKRNAAWPYAEPMVIQRNDPFLQQRALAIGHFNVHVDHGRVWRIPFGMLDPHDQSRKYLHMGLLAGEFLTAKNMDEKEAIYRLEKRFKEEGLLDFEGKFYPKLVRTVYHPFAVVQEMSAQEARQEFEGRAVFIGQTAQGKKFADLWDSAYGNRFGVFFHADTANSLLIEQNESGPSLGNFFQPMLDRKVFLLVGVLTATFLGLIASSLPTAGSFFSGFAILILFWGLSFSEAAGLLGAPKLWPTAGFSLTILLLLLGVFLTRSGLAEGLLGRRRREIQVLQQEEDVESSERIDVLHVDRQIANMVRGEELKADWCSIREKFQGEEGEELSHEKYGMDNDAALIQMEDALAARIFETGEPLLLSNVSKDFSDVSNLSCPSVMGAPLKDGKEVVGTVIVGGKRKERFGEKRYHPEDLQFFRALAREWSDRIVIARYNRTLELRVNERTLDLQMANDRLKELDRQKSDFMNMVAHDLRTPLTSIRSYAEIMLTYKDEPPETYEEFLTIINDESVRLNGLIDNFLDLARIEAGSFQLDIQPTAFVKLVNHAIAVFKGHAEPKNISLTSEIPPELPNVLCDTDRIAQVLANLLSNALKFTPENGAVTIRVGLMDSPETPGEKMLDVTVEDTGPGVPEHSREKIFQKFGQVETDDAELKKVQAAGTGLGLPLCREFVEKHRGRIWVESEVGKGSAFHFTLYCEGSSIYEEDKETEQTEGETDTIESTMQVTPGSRS